MSGADVTRRAVCGAGAAVMAGGMDVAAATWPLVELRRYRTQAGKRDELIGLFERELVESQEQVGMGIIGTFREPADADRFTWLRGFEDMPAREKGLSDFYFGPVWKAHREAANACIADSDDVLLMCEAWPGSGLAVSRSPRRAPGEGPERGPGRIVVRECWPGDVAAAARWFRTDMGPRLKAGGVEVAGVYVREPAANNFPRLPVREGEDFLVWIERYGDGQAVREAREAPGARRAMETLVLEPTRRSRLAG